jgi:hypothetical protein
MARPVAMRALPSTAERREQAVRRATWVVVVLAFGMWVLLVTAASLWAASVLRDAAAPAPIVLESSTGVVLYRDVQRRTDASASTGLKLFDGDELATSAGATATLFLFDGSRLNLYPSSRVRIEASRIGRLNPSATQERLVMLGGVARLSIPQIENKAHTVNLVTPHGGAAFVPGEYTIRVTDEETRISVWDGRSAAALGSEIVEFEAGQKIILSSSQPRYRLTTALEDVLRNGAFADGLQGWEMWEDREEGRPDQPGRLTRATPSEANAPSYAIRVTRESVVNAHNETGLRQAVDRDVTGARGVVVQARIKLDYASLSGGGYLGSEYPMMLRVRFRDARGSEQTWVQGFYYANPENRPTPIGQRVEQGAWTDVSFDLTQLRNPPATIDSLELFAAGHTYDASIGSVQLLVD